MMKGMMKGTRKKAKIIRNNNANNWGQKSRSSLTGSGTLNLDAADNVIDLSGGITVDDFVINSGVTISTLNTGRYWSNC